MRLRKVGTIALFWSGMPYPDPGRSPRKTLGRPSGRVKALCVPFCVPSAAESGGATVRGCGNGSPELGRTTPDRTTAGYRVGRTEAFSRDVGRSLRPASLARCTGHRAGSPLVAAISSEDLTERAGPVIMSAQSSACAPSTLVSWASAAGLLRLSLRDRGPFGSARCLATLRPTGKVILYWRVDPKTNRPYARSMLHPRSAHSQEEGRNARRPVKVPYRSGDH